MWSNYCCQRGAPKSSRDGVGMTILKLPTVDATAPTARAKALVFEDPNSREVLRLIERIAKSHESMLVTGESGTGKELVARHIHELSSRRKGPFVALHCGAFSEMHIESELFGHERGAFAGATWTRQGCFEAAHGGTLFLDGIGNLPLPVQVKILRALEEREVVRLGSRQAHAIDVRLVAATTVHLDHAVAAGRFREDLYFRLNAASVGLPPLRDRKRDILPLARYFLNVYRRRLNVPEMSLSRDAEHALLAYPWPGNIRELEDVIHRALLVTQGDRLTANDLRLPLTYLPAAVPPESSIPPNLTEALVSLFEQGPPNLYATVEETLFRAAYAYCDRNQVQTARLLGISRNIVRARLLQYGELTPSPSRAPAATPGLDLNQL